MVATNGDLTVVLDTQLDADLKREGIAREFISVLQNARKQAGLEVSDRILVQWQSAEPEVREALAEHAGIVAREVLATTFAEGTGTRDTCRINEHDVGYGIDKA